MYSRVCAAGTPVQACSRTLVSASFRDLVAMGAQRRAHGKGPHACARATPLVLFLAAGSAFASEAVVSGAVSRDLRTPVFGPRQGITPEKEVRCLTVHTKPLDNELEGTCVTSYNIQPTAASE